MRRVTIAFNADVSQMQARASAFHANSAAINGGQFSPRLIRRPPHGYCLEVQPEGGETAAAQFALQGGDQHCPTDLLETISS